MLNGTELGAAALTNPNGDLTVNNTPDSTTAALEFSPSTILQTYLIAGGWDNTVRCWEVQQDGQSEYKAIHAMSNAILDLCWSGDGRKVFMASCNKQVNCWDLATNQTIQVAAHDASVSTCHWVETPSYTCILTGSWDKTIKLWDLRSPIPMMSINLPEKAFCADVEYPIAVIGTASNGLLVLNLEGTPSLSEHIKSPFKHQHRCISLTRDSVTNSPTGFCYGNMMGRVGIFPNIVEEHVQRDFFSFKCHRRHVLGIQTVQNIYAVNDIKSHPIHGSLATVGSDGTYAFWDKATRTRLLVSNILDQPITKCCFSSNGQIFAYSSGYDWSQDNEYRVTNKPKIFLRPCFDDLKPKPHLS